jgi:ABC-type molybdate transport system substrate-binding protein
VRYQIAIVSSTKNHADAAAFIKRLTSTAGRKLLVDNGFGVPKLPPVKKPPKKKKK